MSKNGLTLPGSAGRKVRVWSTQSNLLPQASPVPSGPGPIRHHAHADSRMLPQETSVKAGAKNQGKKTTHQQIPLGG